MRRLAGRVTKLEQSTGHLVEQPLGVLYTVYDVNPDPDACERLYGAEVQFADSRNPVNLTRGEGECKEAFLERIAALEATR